MMPTLFISHGVPDLELTRPPVATFLAELSQIIPRPKTILCVSAHWDTVQPTLGGASQPDLIYDFFGFPQELGAMKYPVGGNPGLANEVQRALSVEGIDTLVEPQRGLDHGAWVPLRLMYPAADIPVVQLSVQSKLQPAHHLTLGRLLRPLREQNVLILGSGGATHNLGEFGRHSINAQPVDKAIEFDQWLEGCISNGNENDLLQYIERGPHAQWNHPTVEHFLPLFVPLGASAGTRGQRLHKSFTYGVLSMAAYGWGL